MIPTLFAVLSTTAAVLILLAVTLKLAVTGEMDWSILAAGLLVVPAAMVAWRRSARRRKDAAERIPTRTAPSS